MGYWETFNITGKFVGFLFFVVGLIIFINSFNIEVMLSPILHAVEFLDIIVSFIFAFIGLLMLVSKKEAKK